MNRRRILGQGFALLAGTALGLSLLVLILIITITALQAGPITAMRAVSNAGIALSLRTLDLPEASLSYSYVLIAQIEESSPAAELGMARGDALLVVGEKVDRPKGVWDAVRAAPGGREVALPVVWVPRSEVSLGILRSVAEGGSGVVLAAPSPAAREAGFQPGDILLAIGGVPIMGARQAWEVLVVMARTQGAPVALTVKRGRNPSVILYDPTHRGEVRFVRNPLRAWWEFFTRLNEPRHPEKAGLLASLLGSVYVVLVMVIVGFPLGIAGAVYLEEYAPKTVWTRIIEVLVANLAGIPSAVVGIVGLAVFARAIGLGTSILAGGLTLSVLILPLVIVATREALRAVPRSLREASLAVGATRWETVRHHILPNALPAVLTGTIVAISRALGEAAPLLFLGAFLFVTYLPQGLKDSFTVVPLQIFAWSTRPQDGFATVAAAASLIILSLVLLLNAVAIVLRNHFQRRWSG